MTAEERVAHTPQQIAKKVVDDFFSLAPKYRTGERLEGLIGAELSDRTALVDALRAVLDDEVLYAWVNEKNLCAAEYGRRSKVIADARAARGLAAERQNRILKACEGMDAEQVIHAINEWKALYAK